MKKRARLTQHIHPDTPIYRFFPLKYGLEAIEEKKLILVKPSQWEDPYEKALYSQKQKSVDHGILSIESLRDCFYAQCWTEEGNSDALWRIYSQDKNAFRVTTTVRKLREAISKNHEISDSNCFIGKVNYCHQEIVKQLFSKMEASELQKQTERNSIDLFFIKRNAFQYEREVRIVYKHSESIPKSNTTIKSFDINPNYLFERLLFDPRISKEKYDKLKERIKKSGYKNKISRSNMYEDP